MTRILSVCGSLQANSKNRALLNIAASAAPANVDITGFDGLADLPHFNPDIEAIEVPESVRRWRQALESSDAVLIACPEYGHSLPGVLKNAIDWVIGSGELEGKVVAITAAVPGPRARTSRVAGAEGYVERCSRHDRGWRADFDHV